MPYEYRLIPAPRRAKRAKGARTPADRYAHTLTEMINAEADDGWEYLRADTLPVDEKKSMLGAATETFQTVLVFRRDRGVAEARPEPRPVMLETEPPMTKLSLGPAERRS